ncbi:MAG: hypothetical protein ACTH44_13650 [Brevibacterium aurantiacum]|uniref:hypothetical protein n=1 Tax=Brevibacterium aurantiacum TaxID=273384 RepID=UPI003F8E4B35
MWNISSTGPVSIASDFLMTSTRSAISVTTPMTWVMKMIPASRSFLSTRSSANIYAWIFTSSAVVGSSAMRNLGWQVNDMRLLLRGNDTGAVQVHSVSAYMG